MWEAAHLTWVVSKNISVMSKALKLEATQTSSRVMSRRYPKEKLHQAPTKRWRRISAISFGGFRLQDKTTERTSSKELLRTRFIKTSAEASSRQMHSSRLNCRANINVKETFVVQRAHSRSKVPTRPLKPGPNTTTGTLTFQLELDLLCQSADEVQSELQDEMNASGGQMP